MNNENYIQFNMNGEAADYDMHGNKSYLFTSRLIGGALHALCANGVVAADKIDSPLEFAKKAYENFAKEASDVASN